MAEASSLLHYLISTDENCWLHLCAFICSVAGCVCSCCLGGLTKTRGLEQGGSGGPAPAWPWCGDGSMGAWMGQSQAPQRWARGVELTREKTVCKYFLSQTRSSARSRSQSTYKHPALPSTSPCSSDAGWVQQCPPVLVLMLNRNSVVLPALSFRLAAFLKSSAVNCPFSSSPHPPLFFFLTIN